MTTTAAWLVPLLLLPGVGLILMSTAARYGQVHAEVHHLLDHDQVPEQWFTDQLRMRARLFRNAIVSLYISITAFAGGSILGVTLDMAGQPSDKAIILFALIGILGVIYSSATLIRESVLSVQVINQHLDELNRQHEPMQ